MGGGVPALIQRADDAADSEHRKVASSSAERADRLVEGGFEVCGTGAEGGIALSKRGDLALEFEDPADTLEADPARSQLGHLAQEFDVSQRIAPSTTAGATRRHDAQPVVLAQGLRVQAG